MLDGPGQLRSERFALPHPAADVTGGLKSTPGIETERGGRPSHVEVREGRQVRDAAGPVHDDQRHRLQDRLGFALAAGKIGDGVRPHQQEQLVAGKLAPEVPQRFDGEARSLAVHFDPGHTELKEPRARWPASRAVPGPERMTTSSLCGETRGERRSPDRAGERSRHDSASSEVSKMDRVECSAINPDSHRAVTFLCRAPLLTAGGIRELTLDVPRSQFGPGGLARSVASASTRFPGSPRPLSPSASSPVPPT